MKKALVVAVLGMFVALGLGTAVIAQQTDSSSGAASESQPANPTDKSSGSSSPSATTPKANDQGPATSAMPSQDRSSSSSTTSVEIKPGQRSDSGESVAASPRTSSESRRIFGLDPTAAVLIAAAVLVIVVLALVAMSRGGTEPSSHTDIDFDRRR